MYDAGTLHRLREAIERYRPPGSWRALDDEALAAILQATFCGATPFGVEPDDVVVLRLPGETGEAMREQVGRAARAAWPEHRVVVLAGDLELTTRRELLELLNDTAEEPADVAL